MKDKKLNWVVRAYDWIDSSYGNRKTLFDLLLSLVLTILAIYLFPDILIKFRDIDIQIKTSVIGFLGVLLGFILTAFSILYVYSPSNDPSLNNFRKSSAYKDALKAFIGCSFFLFLATISLIFLTIQNSATIFWATLLLSLTALLRFLKCMYYLVSIIEITNSSD